jgi:hypothetical protein
MATDALLAAVRTLLHEGHQEMRQLVAGLDAETLAWRPPAPNTNSITGLVCHALDSERFQLNNALDRSMVRSREAKFARVVADSAELTELIDTVEPALDLLLDEVGEADLLRTVSRGSQVRTGATWLIRAPQHTQEHIGQAQLTRDLYLARGV